MINTIKEISLQKLLPQPFSGMEESDRIKSSQIWMKNCVKIDRGCRLCITAESGTGKSSLLSFINGSRTDYSGLILFDGIDARTFTVSQWSELRRTHLALLPQEMRLFPELTVMENIEIKNQLTRYISANQLKKWMERLGVGDIENKKAARISLGQQQRVAIIRALCQPFDFIFLDEPVSHLDTINNQEAAKLIEEVAIGFGAGIVTTSVGNNLMLNFSEYIKL